MLFLQKEYTILTAIKSSKIIKKNSHIYVFQF